MRRLHTLYCTRSYDTSNVGQFAFSNSVTLSLSISLSHSLTLSLSASHALVCMNAPILNTTAYRKLDVTMVFAVYIFFFSQSHGLYSSPLSDLRSKWIQYLCLCTVTCWGSEGQIKPMLYTLGSATIVA